MQCKWYPDIYEEDEGEFSFWTYSRTQEIDTVYYDDGALEVYSVRYYLSDKADTTFDESKVMLGFDNIKDAREAYMANYSPDWKGFRCITGVPLKIFKQWLYRQRRQRKPFSEYTRIRRKKITESKK